MQAALSLLCKEQILEGTAGSTEEAGGAASSQPKAVMVECGVFAAAGERERGGGFRTSLEDSAHGSHLWAGHGD